MDTRLRGYERGVGCVFSPINGAKTNNFKINNPHFYAEGYCGGMSNKNVPYPMQYAQLAASISGRGFLAWLYWVRVWLGLFCEGAEDAAGWQIETPKPLLSNRAQRRWAVHYHRCDCPIADRLHILRMMLPPGLTENQKLERLSHISKMGRVRIYGLRRPHPLRHTRARGLCIYKRICSLRPP